MAEGVPGDVALPVEDYAYDEEGNRTASHLSALYASNAHNQLLEDEDYTYAYDARGNRVSRTAKADGAVETYTYDSQNRLVGYVSPTTNASYAYDAMERRIAKTVDADVTAYIYDTSMQNALAHDDIVLEFEAGPTPFLAQRWVHSPSVDEPVGFETYLSTSAPGDGVERAMYADRLGSVLYVTAPATGNVLAAYEYDGYGAITQTQSTLVQPFGYTGREFDSETGLYYYRARNYDPATGTFIQSDPIGFHSKDLNIYRYTTGNPFKFTDPSGLETLEALSGTSRDFVMAASAGLLTTAYTGYLLSDILTKMASDDQWALTGNNAYPAIGGPGGAPDPKCESWLATMKRVLKEINKKTEQIALNPGNLPQFGPGANMSTVQGHRRVINRLWNDYNKAAEYRARHCN